MDREIGECFNGLNEDSNCRAIILSGAGKVFTAGESCEHFKSVSETYGYRKSNNNFGKYFRH